MDAVFKARVLQYQPERSVDLFLTPACAPLMPMFQAVAAVRSVGIDAKAASTQGHGEQTRWSVPLDKDMTYPGFPPEWVVNYVASYSGGPRIRRQDWFGSFSRLLPEWPQARRDALYLDAETAGDPRFLAELRERLPGVRIEVGDAHDPWGNMFLAAGCASRLVVFDVEMALLGALGMRCLVNQKNRNPGRYADLFRTHREVLLRPAELLEKTVAHVVAAGKRPVRLDPSASAASLAICIPTICCADLVAESVQRLLPQLGDGDAICVIDNGRQNLQFASERIRLIQPPSNLGVSGSWNRFLKEMLFNHHSEVPRYDWVLMMNDDVSLGAGQLERIRATLSAPAARDKWMVVGPFNWSVFAINRQCVQNVGFFDEEFFPAYFEDNDYHRRLNLVDETKYAGSVAELMPEHRRNSETHRRMPQLIRFNHCQERYLAKWGGPPGAEQFVVPFDRV